MDAVEHIPTVASAPDAAYRPNSKQTSNFFEAPGPSHRAPLSPAGAAPDRRSQR